MRFDRVVSHFSYATLSVAISRFAGCPQSSARSDSRQTLSHFGMHHQSSKSSVAAGGITLSGYSLIVVSYPYRTQSKSFNYNDLSRAEGEGSSLWLSHPVSSGIVPSVFQPQDTRSRLPPAGGAGRGACAPSPAFCCLDFPRGTVRYPSRIRIPMYTHILPY